MLLEKNYAIPPPHFVNYINPPSTSSPSYSIDENPTAPSVDSNIAHNAKFPKSWGWGVIQTMHSLLSSGAMATGEHMHIGRGTAPSAPHGCHVGMQARGNQTVQCFKRSPTSAFYVKYPDVKG